MRAMKDNQFLGQLKRRRKKNVEKRWKRFTNAAKERGNWPWEKQPVLKKKNW